MFDLFNLEQETEQVTKNILNKAKKETIKKVTKQIESETKQETESETKQETESKVKKCLTVGEFIDRLQDLIKKGYGNKDIFVNYSQQWRKIYKMSKDSTNDKYSNKRIIIETLSIDNDYKTFNVSDIYNCMLESNFNKDYKVITENNNIVTDIDIDIDDSVTIGIEEDYAIIGHYK